MASTFFMRVLKICIATIVAVGVASAPHAGNPNDNGVVRLLRENTPFQEGPVPHPDAHFDHFDDIPPPPPPPRAPRNNPNNNQPRPRIIRRGDIPDEDFPPDPGPPPGPPPPLPNDRSNPSSESSADYYSADLAPSSDSSDYYSADLAPSSDSSDSYHTAAEHRYRPPNPGPPSGPPPAGYPAPGTPGAPPAEIIIMPPGGSAPPGQQLGKRTVSIFLERDDDGKFLGPINVGGKYFKVVFSFVTSRIWVFGKEAEAELKGDGFSHTYYDDKAIGKKNAKPFKVNYLDHSSFEGRAVEDIFKLGGLKVNPREVGVVVSKTLTPTSATRMDGVLGLGLGYTDKRHPPSLLLQMAFLNGMRSLMSLRLAKDGQSGELLIGDESVSQKHFHAPLTYAPVVKPLKGWVVKFNAFRFGKKQLARDQHIEVNLASKAIWAPRSVMGDIVKLTNGEAKWDDDEGDGEEVTIDCDKRESLPHLVFEFNGVSHAFEPHEYFPAGDEASVTSPDYYTSKDQQNNNKKKCTLFMKSSGESSITKEKKHHIPGPMWSLGVPFFQKFYTVYDTDADEGVHRVGFALAKFNKKTHQQEPAGDDDGKKKKKKRKRKRLRGGGAITANKQAKTQ